RSLWHQKSSASMPLARSLGRPWRSEFGLLSIAKSKLAFKGTKPMSKVTSGPQDGTSDIHITTFRLAGLSAAGVWLVALIVTSVGLAVIIFSATQFQARLASLSMNGGPFTIWKAEPLLDHWMNARKLLEESTKTLAKDQVSKTSVSNER